MSTARLRLSAIAMAVAVTFTGFLPAQAMNIPQPVQVPQASSPVVNVYSELDYRRGGIYYRGDRDMSRSSPRYIRRDRDYGWYNGHRGYRDRRPGYRYNNGFWFPLAAFGAGALIGGALAQPAPAYRAAPAYRGASGHVSWCQNRYRSYRAYDNTFQPNNGPRRQCVSPYG